MPPSRNACLFPIASTHTNVMSAWKSFMSSGITNLNVVIDYHPFSFFATRRSLLDFGFGPFSGRSDANPPAEHFIPLRL